MHYQQVNGVGVCVKVESVYKQRVLHLECFWPPGWHNLEFLRAVWVKMVWHTLLALSSSITLPLSSNLNWHIVCLSVHLTAMLTTMFVLVIEIAFRVGMKDKIRVLVCDRTVPNCFVCRVVIILNNIGAMYTARTEAGSQTLAKLSKSGWIMEFM